MISSMRYLPLCIASTVMVASFLYKILGPDVKLTYFLRDIILFFILYYVVHRLVIQLEKIFKNYWKIM